VTGGAMAKEVVTTPSIATSGVEEEPPSSSVAEEVKQTTKDA